jgi:hypothetical protein
VAAARLGPEHGEPIHGRDDLYPFVLPTPVMEKLRFIHNVIYAATAQPAALKVKVASSGG